MTRSPDRRDGAPARIAFFSNDPSGLGHLRRTLKIAWYLHSCWPDSRQLIVTGSPGAQILPLPDGAELLKVPSIASSGFRKHAARYLPMSFEHIRDLRRDLLLDLARHYQPDLALVDHLPAGPGGDLVPCLREMKARAPATRLVLGLRDVTYEPGLLRRAWQAEGVWGLLEEVYDLILVYGQQELLDAPLTYAFPAAIARKTRHVGYLGQPTPNETPEAARTRLGLDAGRLVLATVGGGDVGLGLLDTMVDALALMPGARPFECVLAPGPLTPPHRIDGLRERASQRPGLRVLRHVPDLSGYVAAADVVVATAGYNTVCEILSVGRSAILVPQAHENGEQLARAQLMRRFGLFRVIEPSELSPRRLLADVLGALERPPAERPPVDLHGLAAAATELERLLATRE